MNYFSYDVFSIMFYFYVIRVFWFRISLDYRIIYIYLLSDICLVKM